MKRWQFVSVAVAATAGLLVLGWPSQPGLSAGATALAAVSQAEAVSIAIEPASASLAVGEFVDVQIRVNAGAQQVDKVDVFVDFNPAVLRVVDAGGSPATGVTPGTTLKQVSQNRVDAALGQITYSACCVEAGGAATGPGSGSFVVASVRFRGVAAGSSSVSFSMTPPRVTAVYAPATAGGPGPNILTGPINNGAVTVTGGAGATATPTATATATPMPTATPTATATATPAPNAAPTLTGPDDGVTVSDMAPLLRWNNPTGTTQYQVQVLPAPNPFTGVPDGPSINLIIGDPALVRQPQLQVQAPKSGVGNYFLLPGMTYTWRVRTTTVATSVDEQDPRWGPWMSRTFRTPALTSSTVTLLPPEREVESKTPTLRWTNGDTRVFYYEVQVSEDPSFTTDPKAATAMVYWELRHGGVTNPINSYTIPTGFPLQPATMYCWRVRLRVQGDATPVDWTPPSCFVSGGEPAPACFTTATTDPNGDVYLPPYPATFDSHGNVIMPTPVATDSTGAPLPAEFNSGPNDVVDHWVNADLGSLTTLYPNLSPSSPSLYNWLNSPENPCGPPSIGGETPDEPADADEPDIENEAVLNEVLEKAGQDFRDIDPSEQKALPSINVGPWTPDPNGPCDPASQPPPAVKNCGLPGGALQGRDIIFVNGLLLDAVRDINLGAGPLLPLWPDDPSGILTPSGYWKKAADRYWDDHIKHFLTDRSRKNRYLTIAYPMSQRLEVGRNAMLTQLAMAMASGHAVVNPDPSDPRGTSGFCYAGCVVISHSTGALLTDVTMATAADPALALQFGAVQYIPNFIKLHVTLGGAISGSQIATAVVAAASYPNTVYGSYAATFCPVVNKFLGNPSGTPCTPSAIITQSILVDLIPIVNKLKWAPVIGQPSASLGGRTPMATLTVASGNHENYWAIKRWLALGLDDGVLTMDSACGKETYPGWPSGFLPIHPLVNTASSISPLVFDMGIDGLSAISAHSRATRFFREQTYEHILNPLTLVPARVAAACTPYLSSWGMVEPVQSLITGPASPMTYYPNHYPFVQTAESHTAGLKEGKEWGFEDTLATSAASANIMNNAGGLGLVDAAIEGQVHEYVRGPHRTFWTPINITVASGPCGTPPAGKSCKSIGGFAHAYFNKQFHTVWLWKRTYHRFVNWEQREAAEYVYQYALPAP